MGSFPPPEAPSRRLSPAPENVGVARRFVRSVLAGSAPEVVDTAELLVGELMTNAVIHARTEAEVAAWVVEGRAHVRVSDHRPDRGLVPHDRHPYALTGRGLALVEELATSHGVHSGEGRKSVWFELWPQAPAPPTSAWETVAPPGRPVTVTLNDVPYSLYWAAQQQWEGALRELFLAAFTACWTGVLPEDLVVAQDMSNMICSSMTAAVRQETPDSSTLSLLVAFPVDAAAGVVTLRRVLEEADVAARRGNLLTLPALPQIRAFRHWLFDQITNQLSGGHPTAWTLVSGAPSATPTELAPWDASEAEAANVPIIAADDRNRIIAVNSAAAGLLGWRAYDLLGQRLTALIPEHLRERHRMGFSSLLLTGESRILGRSIPVPALHRDGRLVPVRLAIQTQEAVDGRTVFVAQLTPATSPPVASGAAETGGYATRPVPGPVHLPTTTKGAKKGDIDEAELELSLFADTGRALASTLDLHEGLRRVCHVLTRQLADWCAADLLDEQGQVLRVCIAHQDPQVRIPGRYYGRFPPLSDNDRVALARALRGAGPLLVADIPPLGEASSPLDARQLELMEELGGDSAIIAPLRAQREVIGALTLVRVREANPFTKEDILLVAELARAIALGVDNALLHHHTHSNAEHLQRALLPELPRAGHVELAARYLPSSTTAVVGGDWYDAFVLPGGDTVLVIGDVTGHDLTAAVSMSTLRNMLRGLAVDRPEPPGEVLHRLDRASQILDPQATGTCVYALLKKDGGGGSSLHYSSAGHLPPLLTTREGETHYLVSGNGLLIGMDADLPRPTAVEALPPHSTLLFFTDGLIERRGESLEDAMNRLRRYTTEYAREPLDVFCDELIIEFGADSTDDIAVLAVRPTPPQR
ncbi:SpoIIE family protein phosphatase [Streptomyces palmae]|uniref:protein-serine/threonine phosphatase n=1 Tax=Streptomyces palmae TaxID=1701085 RepID=A0A4Z0HBB4_9ACTN|nr:SpoIIE family protein phosphatase [Streptomyces palmae]TGB16205.1 PAS domain S-box protein [Streptomyces palmae]